MVTLPGLPMLGHGQVEGFREKYGMEYRYAKWDENVDEGLVRGHEWRIFPLTHRRYIFAEVDNFLLYDFYTPEGGVNEDVFAYSNRSGDERGLVLYQNKFANTSGWVKTAAAYMDKASGNLVQKALGEGLALPVDGYAIFTDYVTRLEYIRPCRELVEKGMFVRLGPFQSQVFLDWRFVGGDAWRSVCEALNGAGVPSMQGSYDEMFVVKEEMKSEPGKGKKKTATKERVTRKPVEKKAVEEITKSKKKVSTARKKKPAKKPA
jgi:hypothetical protein